ncbi:MAG: aminoglycoside phosphotransferase, partial [Comamonadaceae bacterium]|nr:aminoglycoside phosphotransferase [Comamonadaceae bacterium]
MTPNPNAVPWADPQREAACHAWLLGLAGSQGLRPQTLRPASADASFRRYLRVDTVDGASRIVMDAPPEKENCRPFVQVADLMKDAGLLVPQILAWDEPQGFMLLSDLGAQTMMEQIDATNPQANHARYLQAVDTLLAWQLASRPGVLPAYDEPLLRRELQLFPDWYLAQHRQTTLQGKDAETLSKAFDSIVKRCLAAPSVYVHRDFMPRNLMIPGDDAPTLPAARGSLPPEGAVSPWGGPAAK